MKIAIIVSEKDSAGLNIKKNLLKNYEFKETGEHHGYPMYLFNNISLYTIKKDTIFYEEIESEIKADQYIFATRHQSESGEKTLSIHIPGNYDKAEYGGQKRELCTGNASMMKHAYKLLYKNAENTDFAVTLESTHHGPLIRTPVFFIEIGSREEQWQDMEAGQIIAKTIMETIETFEKNSYKIAIGFGGTHYCSGFNRIELETSVAISHICPKYALDNIGKELVEKMIHATKEKVEIALLDWKGMNSEQRQKIILILDELNVEWEKTKKIR